MKSYCPPPSRARTLCICGAASRSAPLPSVFDCSGWPETPIRKAGRTDRLAAFVLAAMNLGRCHRARCTEAPDGDRSQQGQNQ
jgi:hypothetical protein